MLYSGAKKKKKRDPIIHHEFEESGAIALIPGSLAVIKGKLLNHFCLFICKTGATLSFKGLVRTE